MVNAELLLLDGATGTELNRRGVDTGLPMWSANALTTDTGLNVLRQIHLDYLNAGERPVKELCAALPRRNSGFGSNVTIRMCRPAGVVVP